MYVEEIWNIGYNDGYAGIRHPTEFRFPYCEEKETESSRMYKIGWLAGMEEWIYDTWNNKKVPC